MKKAIVLLVVVSLLGTGFKYYSEKKEQRDIIRIHILAASDSESDQNIKIKVRDAVNEFLAPKLTQCATKADAENALNGSAAEIKEIAETVAGTASTVTLSNEYFPEKTYGSKTYPEGTYTALIIKIGEGAGHNWWCVAFPPMCYTSGEAGKVEYRSVFVTFLEHLGVIK